MQTTNKCNTCQRFESLPCQYPTPLHLPDFRVQGTDAFSSAGTDLAGPLYIRCTLSGAVHLEILLDMSAEQFNLALMSSKRFISRKGTSSLIVSNNAKTFKESRLIKM